MGGADCQNVQSSLLLGEMKEVSGVREGLLDG